MALLKEITDYRKKIMKAVCNNEKIVQLLTDNPDATAPNRELMYSKVFPYAFTPTKTEDTSTYICFRILVPKVYNKTIKEMGIVFYIFTNQKIIRTEDGLRTDLIAEEIEEMFNGSLDLGAGAIELEGMDDISPAINFHGVALEYSVSEFNRPTTYGRG